MSYKNSLSIKNKEWLYIPSDKIWWRTIGNPLPKSGKVFLKKPIYCERCFIQYKDNLAYELNTMFGLLIMNLIQCLDC